MNKTALRNFAINARNELLEKVTLQARKLGITKDKIADASIETSDAVYIDGRLLTSLEGKQRNKVISRIEEIGFDQVMEETAYTWFNRFVALRFMEVNDYLPTRVRVLSSETEGSTEPDMIREALSLNLPIDKEYVYNLKVENDTEKLFKYLIKLHCNDLNRYMPFMFETIEDYTEILFPEGLLSTDSFVKEMIDTENIPEEDWQHIEVIGWLYQFYISEEKDRVFKEKKKYKPEEIPFATQLFTPDWIVQYMVQNSLGRYWIEAHPEHHYLTKQWEFYLEHEQENFQEMIAPYVNNELNVEEIKCFDPAMGSGHILVYMFDILYQIYSECGYMEREIPRLIIENNLYGLDIDDRATQLASFSVVMKALTYNRRFLRNIEKHGLTLHLASIQETNGLTEEDIAYLAAEENDVRFEETKKYMEQFKNAKSIGSLLKLTETGTEFLERRLEEIINTPAQDLFDEYKRGRILNILPSLIKQTKIMRNQYDILATNPPYMNPNSNSDLHKYVKRHYPDSKGDLFASFMEINHFLKENSLYAMINQHAWMFLSSYEKLRDKVINHKFIDTMLHLGPRAFEEIGGEVVQSTTFVMRNVNSRYLEGVYIRLVDYSDSSKKRKGLIAAVQKQSTSYRYSFNQKMFKNIPEKPIAYWIIPEAAGAFKKGVLLKYYMKPRAGLATGNNNIFQMLWHEVEFSRIGFDYDDIAETETGIHKWFPCNSGGKYRKWSTNDEYVVDWENNGVRIKSYRNTNGKLAGRPQNTQFYFKEGLTWNKLSNTNFSVKLKRKGFIFDDTSRSAFVDEEKHLYYIIGLLCSKISLEYLNMLNPTLSFTNGDLERIPLLYSQCHSKQINTIVIGNIDISKNDWDSFETSWDFTKHPLLKFPSQTIESSYKDWNQFAESQFNELKENEEELNQIFIEIYGLQDELTPDVVDKDVTVNKADLERDIKSFISYAVGCTFGRYSLDEEGLIYAGGEFDLKRYQTFHPDENNILPILPGAYFEDDIVTRFIFFVEITYGKDTLEENLDFVSDAIGKRKNETSREAIRRYFLNNFYKDHVQTYKKCPIYWLFTSGKEKAFNCLIYMHRYNKTTLSRIRTDYLHDVQVRYETERKDLLAVIEGEASAKEIRDAKKQLTSVEKKIDELKAYDEKLHHLADQQIDIDLDDGVEVNYDKFKGLVAKR